MLADSLSVTLRALSFIALFQAAGMAMFIALFGRELTVSERLIRRVGTISAFAAGLLVLGHYALEAARMSGELASVMDPTLQGMVMQSPASVALAWRLVGLLLIVAGFRLGNALGIALGLTGATTVLAAFTLLGHTASHSERWLLSVLLLVHLLVIAFWFGALLPLYAVATRESATTAGAIVERFSSLAVWLVPVLFLAGILVAAILLQGWAALLSPYGRLLIAKVMGFAVLMGLAALNKWRLGPSLGRNDGRASLAFRRSLIAEHLLISAVLSVTAALTTFYSPEG